MNIRPHWYLLSQTVLKQGIVLLWQGAVEDFSINPTTAVQANVLGIDIIVHFAGKSYYDTFTSMHIGHNTYFGAAEDRIIKNTLDLVPCGLVAFAGKDFTVSAVLACVISLFHDSLF